MQRLEEIIPPWGESCGDLDYLDLELWRKRKEHRSAEEVIALFLGLLHETKGLAWVRPTLIPREVLRPTEVRPPLPSIVSKYADNQVKDMLLEEDNPYLVNLLRDSLNAVEEFVRDKRLYCKIDAVLEMEPEVPEARWITIVLKTDVKDFKEQMFLWKSIERRIQKIVDRYLEMVELEQDRKQIKVANALIAISVTK